MLLASAQRIPIETESGDTAAKAPMSVNDRLRRLTCEISKTSSVSRNRFFLHHSSKINDCPSQSVKYESSIAKEEDMSMYLIPSPCLKCTETEDAISKWNKGHFLRARILVTKTHLCT